MDLGLTVNCYRQRKPSPGRASYPTDPPPLQTASSRPDSARVRPDASRSACIVMEFVPDLDITTADRCSVVGRREFAASTLNAMYQMLFINGFVHCDLHPGNLYFLSTGRVVVLDAGFSVQLSKVNSSVGCSPSVSVFNAAVSRR